MKNGRSGMTLFELLVVMSIVGIVYSIGIFAMDKKDFTTSDISLPTLKKALSALEHTGKITLFCHSGCDECTVLTDHGKNTLSVRLRSSGEITRYGFDRFGELHPLGPVVTRVHGKMEEGCFAYSLYPDGTSSPLIVKEANRFYAYTPLGGDVPFVTDSEEALKDYIHDEKRYPLTSDGYYAAP